MRRAASLAAAAAAVLILAGCGGEKVVSPAPETVIGTVQQESPGKGVFAANGCGGCHVYTPAGPEAAGKVGPDLDKLAQFAKKAGKPLDEFVRQSIVDPNAYVEKGYPKGVMPDFSKLPDSDVSALVDFLTKPQG
jgi:cytochrome c551/c552